MKTNLKDNLLSQSAAQSINRLLCPPKGSAPWRMLALVMLTFILLVGDIPRALASTTSVTPSDLAAMRAALQVSGPAAQQAYLKASNTHDNDMFGWSVAVSGDTAVIGAPQEMGSGTGVNPPSNHAANHAGAAYVFVRINGAWTFQAYLKASNANAEDSFGWSVAISRDTIVVGAPEEDGSGVGVNPPNNDSAIRAGAAYVFVRNFGVWSQQAYLKASNTGASDRFGHAVAISGNTIVVGAYGEDSAAAGVNGNQADNSASGAGAAYVFVRNAATWSMQAYLKASNPGAGDAFGKTVSIAGDTVVIGAADEDGSGTGVNPATNEASTDAGAAYVFVRSAGAWSQQAYLKASNTARLDAFGTSVGVSGDTIVVGAIGEDSNAIGVNGDQNNNSDVGRGAAYVFTRSGTTWSQNAYLKPSNNTAGENFGHAVAISGDLIVVGAPKEDSGGRGIDTSGALDFSYGDSGAAYVFIRRGGIWSQRSFLKSSNSDANDQFAYSVAASRDTVLAGAIGEQGGATGVNGDETDNSLNTNLESGPGAAYVFANFGIDSTPKLALEQPVGTTVASGSTVSFGRVSVGGNGTLTFNLTNTSNTSLTGVAVTKGGSGAADFSIVASPGATLLPGSSTSFVVRFAPTSAVFSMAGLQIISNDADEDPIDITITGSGVTGAAQITSPANGSTLTSTSLELEWNTGEGVSQCCLWIGTKPSGYDLYAGNEGMNRSRTVEVPAGGGKVYVTLWSIIGRAYCSNQYVFTTMAAEKADLIGLTSGTLLTDGTLALNWTSGAGVSACVVWIGSAPGGYDLGATYTGTEHSRNFSVPQDGGPVYVTLWSLINGAYQSNSYWFHTAEPASGSRPARLISPDNSTELTDASLYLSWEEGTGVTSYALWVGSKPDGYDLFAGSMGTATSKSITVPGDGRRIYVTLHSLIDGAYQSNSYFFTAPTLPDRGAAQIIQPANGSTLTSTSLPLMWEAAPGATQYALWVGSAPMGYNLYAGNEGMNLNKTVTVPADGSPVYCTLWSLINGIYLPSSTWFTSANTGAGSKRSKITFPANGSALTGAQTTFTWGGGSGVTTCALWLGSSPGGYDLLAANVTVSGSRAITLPNDGRKIYATLHSLIGGTYRSNSWVFIAADVGSPKAEMTSPSNTSTLAGSTVTFSWNPGSAATSYALWVGRQPGGYDLYAGTEGTRTTKMLTNLPTDGSPIYVTLYSLINGVYQSTEYIYQSANP